MTYVDFLLPILITFVPSLIMYDRTNSQSGLLAGGTMGLVLCVYASLLDRWLLMLPILGLLGLLFKSVRRGGAVD